MRAGRHAGGCRAHRGGGPVGVGSQECAGRTSACSSGAGDWRGPHLGLRPFWEAGSRRWWLLTQPHQVSPAVHIPVSSNETNSCLHLTCPHKASPAVHVPVSLDATNSHPTRPSETQSGHPSVKERGGGGGTARDTQCTKKIEDSDCMSGSRAMIVELGEGLTWDCGHSAKLGRGSGASSPSPTRKPQPSICLSTIAGESPPARPCEE